MLKTQGIKLIIQLKVLALKNKTKTYVLLGLVAIIWGTVGFKIWSGFNPDLPNDIPLQLTTNFNPNVSTVVDTFSIETLERDPFLGKIISKETRVRASKPITKNEDVYTPVLYHGMIAKENSRDKLYIISIENKQHFIKVGQIVNGIKLIKANIDEIRVSYNSIVKTIKKI